MVLDEFHKNLKWKNQLKGFYDTFGENIQIIVTGSAKLNIFRKGADSLLGRFIHFHLLPFSLGELSQRICLTFKEFKASLENPNLLETIPGGSQGPDDVQLLMKFGGFPEPLLAQSDEILNIWTRSRCELLIRQDLKDVTNIIHLGQVEILASFLPDRVSSPLSIQSLCSDLDGSYSSVQRWLSALEQVYFHFVIRPFSKSIPRSLKKEGKIYLWDWTGVDKPGPRFENMVACHLLKLVHYYNDTGQGQLNIHYLRTKDKSEVDFLVTNRNIPLFTVEVKLSDFALDNGFKKFHPYVDVPHFQIVSGPRIFRKFSQACVIDFQSFFRNLP
jgi:predicted AAA+ superfamily ATPase